MVSKSLRAFGEVMEDAVAEAILEAASYDLLQVITVKEYKLER